MVNNIQAKFNHKQQNTGETYHSGQIRTKNGYDRVTTKSKFQTQCLERTVFDNFEHLTIHSPRISSKKSKNGTKFV